MTKICIFGWGKRESVEVKWRWVSLVPAKTWIGATVIGLGLLVLHLHFTLFLFTSLRVPLALALSLSP